MTAEIAILNKSAVALAADSAVTVSVPGYPTKVYNSASKLFTLSKYHPVGIMIYGGVELTGVPWETIIKHYREQLGDKSYDRLEDHADEFVKYLDKSHPLIPEEIQQQYVRSIACLGFSVIREEIMELAEEKIKKGELKTDSQVAAIADNCIEKELERWAQMEPLPHLPKNHPEIVVKRYKNQIAEAKKDVFEKFPFSKVSAPRLELIIGNAFYRQHFIQRSGVVVAGFGANDTFPAIKSFLIDCLVADRLKYSHEEENSTRIDSGNTAAIIPFAQRDVVEAFVKEASWNYVHRSEELWKEELQGFQEAIVSALKGHLKREPAGLKEALQKEIDKLIQQHYDSIRIWQRKISVGPILNTIEALPKTELPAIAEALVSLTALKRKVASDQEETVGGPIDVAIISKGDGFIWINRKHYFSRELNPLFCETYFKKGANGKKED